MKYVEYTTTGLLGLIFFVFGINQLLSLGIVPAPPPMGETAMAYMGGLGASGYFFPVLKLTETICGALLLARVLVPLAGVILTPIVLQIFLFHAVLAPAGLPIAILLVVLVVAGAYFYRDSFKGILTLRAKPSV